MNFRGSGTRYFPVLLSFALLLLLGGWALRSGGPVSELAVTGANPSVSMDFAIPELSADHPHARVDFGQLPLRFEPNQGQTDARVDFLARGAGYGLFLTPDQAVLTLRSTARSASVVRMELERANPAASATGANQLPGKSNYLIGNNPANWHRNIPQFAQVRYQNIYRGVDLVYYGNQGELEYDFEVAPGADPGQIALRFPGLGKASLDGSGNLVLASGGGEVQLKAPHVYQEFGTEHRPVAGRYALRPDGEVAFDLGAYDRGRALVIDPVLSYSTYLGGSGNEACSVILGMASPPSGCPAVAIDASSNIYLAGSTTSANFPVEPPAGSTPAAFQTALSTAPDVFVTKLNAAGSAIVFSTYLGGDGVDTSAGVARGFRFECCGGGHDDFQ